MGRVSGPPALSCMTPRRYHGVQEAEVTVAVAYERMELPADPGLAIVTYSAEPGSPLKRR